MPSLTLTPTKNRSQLPNTSNCQRTRIISIYHTVHVKLLLCTYGRTAHANGTSNEWAGVTRSAWKLIKTCSIKPKTDKTRTGKNNYTKSVSSPYVFRLWKFRDVSGTDIDNYDIWAFMLNLRVIPTCSSNIHVTIRFAIWVAYFDNFAFHNSWYTLVNN